MIPTMFVVTMVVFLLIRFIPGSIVEMMMFQMGGGGESQSEETISPEAIRQWLGLDKPMHVQYVIWMEGIFTRGDFGTSLWTRKPVLPEILARLPITFELGQNHCQHADRRKTAHKMHRALAFAFLVFIFPLGLHMHQVHFKAF